MKTKNLLIYLTLILLFSSFINATAFAAGETYLTDSDNENNFLQGISDNDLDNYLRRWDVTAPIEFNIDMSGALPNNTTHLTIRAFDIDEEEGEIDYVYLNGNFVGFLNGVDSIWSTTVFNVDKDFIVNGNNRVEIQINSGYPNLTSNADWAVTVDWGQLLIDGGTISQAENRNIDIINYQINGDTITINTRIDILTKTTGEFRVEINLVDPAGNATSIVSDNFQSTPNQIRTLNHGTTYKLSGVSGIYTIQALLYFVDTAGVLNQQDIKTLVFEHAAGIGPVDIDNDGVDDVLEIELGTNPFNADSDGDGIFDAEEIGPNILIPLDSDNDGIIDALDSSMIDNDNDGTSNQFDPANNDACIPVAINNVCTNINSDSDAIADINDLDDDNDGIPDSEESIGDTDGDGIPDIRDLDSDNDSIFDIIEAGGIDNNGDGQLDDITDSDNDGLANIVDTDSGGVALILIDSDNDSIPDIIESNSVDSDSDGFMNANDIDADGDGITDRIEAIANSAPGILPVDTDNDNVPDYLDLDSDNDGLVDLIEAGGVDVNGDGRLDNFIDSDADGLANIVDRDSGGIELPLPDSDNDGVRDFRDIDSDNDGIFDLVEAGIQDFNNDGQLDSNIDSDGDGLLDIVDPDSGTGSGGGSGAGGTGGTSGPILLTDSDGDGVYDYADNSPNDPCLPNPNSINCNVNNIGDRDFDGLSDSDEISIGTNPDFADTDADGILDTIEVGVITNPFDADNDGIIDALESNFEDTDNDGIPNAMDIDSDGDGIPDVIEAGENVGRVFNGVLIKALDTDNDTIIDALDLDSDADSVPDFIEGGLRGFDSDGDGIDDAFDIDQIGGLDNNNDGIGDSAKSPDTDGDGLADFRDPDSDNDGISDAAETNLVDIDSDGDGIVNRIDADFTGGFDNDNNNIDDSYYLPNTDADLVADFRDLDSDNDSINDVIEALIQDNDRDGMADIGTFLNSSPIDSDNDGIMDFRDLDSNNDTQLDIRTVAAGEFDLNNDGVVDNNNDTDLDGIANVVDANQVRFGEAGGVGQAPSAADIDGDGIPNANDLDDDNDGIPDIIETSFDFDGDGIINSQDLDSDNDNISDVIEAGFTDIDNNGRVDNFVDANNNGISDTAESVNTGTEILDTDSDGVPNFLDNDSDGDGFPDSQELLFDLDADGIPDYIDKSQDLHTATQGYGSTGFELLLLLAMLSLVRFARRRHLLLATLCLGLITNSHAVETGNTKSDANVIEQATSKSLWPLKRWYLGGDLGVSRLDATDNNSSYVITDDSSKGFRIEMGFDYSKHMSYEAFFLEAGSAKVNSINSSIATLGKLRYHAFGLGLDYRPFWHNKKILPHLKLGISAIRNSVTDDRIRFDRVSTISVYLGAGVSWRFDDNWAVNTEWVSYDKDVGYLSLGIRKYFGGKKSIAIEPVIQQIVEPIAIIEKPKDSDADGIVDVDDMCQNTPNDRIVSTKGCQLDSDGDSVVDALDECENSKLNTKVDNAGCEIPEIIVLRGVNFETNSARLKPDSKTVMDNAANILLRYPDMHVEIAGHTDNRGEQKLNQRLSQSRSMAVRLYLIEKGAIADNLTSVGYGDSQPIDNTDNEDAWMINRRVELHIIDLN